MWPFHMAGEVITLLKPLSTKDAAQTPPGNLILVVTQTEGSKNLYERVDLHGGARDARLSASAIRG